VTDPHPTLPALDEPGDAELISAVRAGDLEAYGTLFERHVEAARRLARQLVSAGDVDDLVSEAFSKVLGVLQRGGGPDLAFRAYLLTSLRRLHVDKIRASSRLTTTDDMTAYDPGVPFEDTAVAGFDSETAAKAFARLPERWQQVLWHTEVEGQKPAEIAPLLGMTPNSVSALAYRAREGLRQAFISMHAQDAVDDACATTRANLGAYIRNGLSRRDSAKVEAHLQECRPCTAIYLELTEVNSNLGALLAPLLLGTAGAGYLAAAAAGTKAGILLFFGGVKNWLLHNPAGRATGVGAGVAAAAVAVAAVAAGGGHEPTKHTADPPPAAASQKPASTPPASTPKKPSKSTPKTTPQPPAASPNTTSTAPPATTAPATSPSTPPPSATTTPEQAPLISKPIPTVTITPGAKSVVIDLTDGATDPNGDPLTVKSASVAKPAHGKVVKGSKSSGRVITGGGGGKGALGGVLLYAKPASGPTTVVYTPDRGWRGTDTIDYTLTDGHGGTVSGSVDVRTPNAAPVAESYTVDARAWWSSVVPVYIWPLKHASDPNDDRLSLTFTQPTNGGSVRQAADGHLEYFSQMGRGPYTDRFTYTVSDGHGGKATGKIKVRVGELPNRAPDARDDGPYTVADDSEDDSLPVLLNDTDADGDKLTITDVDQPEAGTVQIAKDGQSLTYDPAFGHAGTFTFGYTVSDGKGGTDSAEVTVKAEPASDLTFGEVDHQSLGGQPHYDHVKVPVTGIPADHYATAEVTLTGVDSQQVGGVTTAEPDCLPGTAPFTFTCTVRPDDDLVHFDWYSTAGGRATFRLTTDGNFIDTDQDDNTRTITAFGP